MKKLFFLAAFLTASFFSYTAFIFADSQKISDASPDKTTAKSSDILNTTDPFAVPEAGGKKTLLVVETDKDIASESLDRISGGHPDLGFSLPSQSYDSSNHSSGALARSQAHDNTTNTN